MVDEKYFDEDFGDYKKRIFDFVGDYNNTKKDIIIIVLWEILEALWIIGRILVKQERERAKGDSSE